jgi:actin cytoskeleton-regulatory complex protein SLA1
MSEDQDTYLAVLKAAYDYDPQPEAEDEINIKENQTLLLLEKVDDELRPSFLLYQPYLINVTIRWWKVKVKQDEDGPSGLVPAAYVEPVRNRLITLRLVSLTPVSARTFVRRQGAI